ncbi:hypothetical protein PR048_000600 [Dryococelus australis]|uniref:Uncharacterized protein n=1 Tax=Dryococelus australis TaxID=614101 RepID=A0ABQ9IF33_9NEOP|nr:hypothetical protein PR048_000600 [Dryococelus australis]
MLGRGCPGIKSAASSSARHVSHTRIFGVNAARNRSRTPRKHANQWHRPARSPRAKNLGVTRPGIETGSPWWEASRVTAQPPQPLFKQTSQLLHLRDKHGKLDVILELSICEEPINYGQISKNAFETEASALLEVLYLGYLVSFEPQMRKGVKGDTATRNKGAIVVKRFSQQSVATRCVGHQPIRALTLASSVENVARATNIGFDARCQRRGIRIITFLYFIINKLARR